MNIGDELIHQGFTYTIDEFTHDEFIVLSRKDGTKSHAESGKFLAHKSDILKHATLIPKHQLPSELFEI